ncbi:Protein-disulfide isomerase [Sinosporangium album]|uniref:Protein-disulfide isomerase n=1 Tax=Sinosporangium album TaxID=504805 RepID=A0A1G7R614_9ACTN|nr:thioredoxin domain-containing protein [Sinosporangium album]SDG06178.1 Protein-disulfide isomerase [Sinosporangium album]
MSQGKDKSRALRAKVDAMRAEDRRKAARSRNLVATLVVVLMFAVVAAATLAINASGSGAGSATVADGESRVVRADSHRVQTAPDGKVTLVEFLDFECEACRAAYPIVEELRKEYAGKVTFVIRYFPIPGHFNAERSARAVEAAAQQGKFEQMYQRMYETQAQWGEKRVPADDTFRGFAKDLGLDMAAWDTAYNDPATLERIKKDVADGQALGVQGTPTFFVNGEKVELRTSDDLKAAVDAALAG